MTKEQGIVQVWASLCFCAIWRDTLPLSHTLLHSLL